MRHYRRTTSCWMIAQALCFCLLMQGSGIAEAAPHLAPEQDFVTRTELEAAPTAVIPESAEPAEGRIESRWMDAARGAVKNTSGALVEWIREELASEASEDGTPVRFAKAGGVLPLPPRLMVAALFGSTSRGQAGPPRPPGQSSGPVEPTPAAEIARLAEKSTSSEFPLLAGWNLISLPQEPADPDPAAVFADVAGQLARVEVYDACDVTDPWKVYDPADPAGND